MAAEQRIDMASRTGAESLDLSGLRLRRLPPFPAGAKSLRSLNLSGNRVQELPAEIWQLENLRHLDLGNSGVAELPEAVGELKRLRVLDLSENDLTRLPYALGQCSRLQEIYLYRNQITSLTGISLAGVRILDLSTNELTSVDELKLSPRLTWLDVSNNKLDHLPADFSQLQELEYVNLSSNLLASIDPLAGLGAVEELYVDDNNLGSIPLVLADLQSLRIVSADQNPMGRLPAAFDRMSTEALGREASEIISSKTAGGYQEGKKYLVAPSFFFDFTLAITGVGAVFRFIDLFYKRRIYPSVTVKFPDGVSIDLQNVSRKTALAIIQQHEAALREQAVSVRMGSAANVDDTSDLLLKAISRLPKVSIVPNAAGEAPVEIINYNFVNSFNQKEVVQMGDRVHIGSINNSNFNWKSKLDNVSQHLSNSTALDERARAELTNLLSELAKKLDNAPQQKQEDAEAIGEAAEEYVKKATAPKPNKRSIEISGKGLLEAAQAIGEVVPIAINIVSSVGQFLSGLS